MKVDRIEILPHARSPAGSFAIIKLHGISRLAGPPVFRLDPADRANEAADYGWPKGDIKPLGVRAGPRSVEFLIGPEIVKAAALKPGTRVRFRMPSANADLQLEWPALSGDKRAEPKALSASLAAVQTVMPGPAAAGCRLPASSGPHISSDPKEPRERGLARLQVRQPPAQASAPARPHHPPPLPPAFPASIAAITPAAPPAPRSHVGWRARIEAEQAAKARARPEARSMLLPLALGCVIVLSMSVLFTRTTDVEGSNISLFAVLRSVLSPETDTLSPSLAKATAVLSEILGVGATSPAGIAASDAPRREALERANDLLAAATTADQRAEAAFWLRKALARSLAEPRLLWAVTQLGSAYAASDKDSAPNYEAAHLLWTWAADAGDAHAACFLARLHEFGLGVPKDLDRARQSYDRAGRLGGCPGLVEARLRLGSASGRDR